MWQKQIFFRPPPPTVKVYITVDRTVDPATTPITRFGDVYVFADNLLNHTLEVQRDNILVDGAGFILKGVGINAVIPLSYRKNVTIKNVDIRNYVMSVWLQQSSNNTILNNRMLTFLNVILDSSSNNQIIGNNITGESDSGITIHHGSNNTAYENHITNSAVGVYLEFSFEFPDCKVENNIFYRNNFVNITQYVSIGYFLGSNFWDNNEEGNY